MLLPTYATPTEHPSIDQHLDEYASWDQLSHEMLDTIVGYHVVYSWPGATLPPELYDLAHEGKVGGVIIFGENVNDKLPHQIENLQNAYKKSSGYAGKPLLITTDQEGGEIVRLPDGPKKSAKEIGSSKNPQAAASRAGEVAARACKDYNVNGKSISSFVFHSM